MNTYKRSPILRGDILYAELGAAVGSEQAGFRPVVVVQNDVGNRYSPTVVVAPLTSNIRKTILPTHVHVGRESGVRPSLVLLEQLHATHFSLTMPLVSLMLSVGLMLLCRLLQRGQELQKDSDSII